MKHTLAILLVVGLLLAGCADRQAQDVPVIEDEQNDSNQTSMPSDGEEAPEMQEADVVVSLQGRNYEYEDESGDINPTITVQQGDLVRIEFATESGFHDFVIDEFGATEQVRSDAGVQILEFAADEAGEFEYYCSVGSHRAQGMYGSFVVE